MMILSLCRKSVVLALSLHAATATAEFAMPPAGTRYALYFVDGDRVGRGECGDTTVYNRATCAGSLRFAAGHLFFPNLAARFGKDLDAHQRLVRETWVNIEQVDARLLMMVSTAPNVPSSPVTWDDVALKRDELAAVDADVFAAADQVARIVARLAEGETDPDLTLQLDVWRVHHAEATTAQQKLQKELAALTQRYVQDRADASDGEFRDLVAMRADYLTTLTRAQGWVQHQVEDIVAGEGASRKLREQGFTWVSRPFNTIYGSDHIYSAFAETEVETRTFRFTAPHRVSVVNIDIPVTGHLDGISCRFPVYFDNRCDVAIKSPGGYDEAVFTFTSVSGEVKFDTKNNPTLESKLSQAGILRGAVQGAWQFYLACSMISTGPTSGGTACAVRLQP